MADDDPMLGWYANKHIPRVLHNKYASLDDDQGRNMVQIVNHGGELTAATLKSSSNPLTLTRPILVLDQPKSIGMRLPGEKKRQKPNKNASTDTKRRKVRHGNDSSSTQDRGVQRLTVRKVAELLGMDHEVEMIDVKRQQIVQGWTMRNLVDYFENKVRKTRAAIAQASDESANPRPHGATQPTPLRRSPRLRSTVSAETDQEVEIPVLNQISLEFSRTPLEKAVQSPRFVRDLDWIEKVWPKDLKNEGDYPVVQYYCLTSPSGSYTDFHVDFGGSTVWYHVTSGRKTFILIPPTDFNLAAFEKWLGLEDKYEVFFPDHLKSQPDAYSHPASTVRITVHAGQTMVIPSGWIHAVYTPVDSVVIGGNFLHGLNIAGQLKVHKIEERTGCPEEYAFPHFRRMMFFAGAAYLKMMRCNSLCDAEWKDVGQLVDALRQWWSEDSSSTCEDTINECLKTTGCHSMEDMFDEMTALDLQRKLSGGIF